MKKGSRNRLDELVRSERTCLLDDKEIAVLSWKIEGIDVVIDLLYLPGKEKQQKTISIDEVDSFINGLIPIQENIIAPKNITELRNILMDNIARLQNGQLPTEVAKEISNHTQSILNISKLELQYIQQMKGGKGEVPFLDDGLKKLKPTQ